MRPTRPSSLLRTMPPVHMGTSLIGLTAGVISLGDPLDAGDAPSEHMLTLVHFSAQRGIRWVFEWFQ